MRPLPMSTKAASIEGSTFCTLPRYTLPTIGLVAGLVDVVLDEHAVLEHRDLGALAALPDDHDPVDRLAPGEELRLGDDRRAAPTWSRGPRRRRWRLASSRVDPRTELDLPGRLVGGAGRCRTCTTVFGGSSGPAWSASWRAAACHRRSPPTAAGRVLVVGLGAAVFRAALAASRRPLPGRRRCRPRLARWCPPAPRRRCSLRCRHPDRASGHSGVGVPRGSWPSGSPSSCSGGCWPSPPGPSLPESPAALRPRPPASPASPSGGGWKSTWGGWNVAAGTAGSGAGAPVPAASARPAGAPVAPGAPGCRARPKRMATVRQPRETMRLSCPDGDPGTPRPSWTSWHGPGGGSSGGVPWPPGPRQPRPRWPGASLRRSAVFISGERAPLRSLTAGLCIVQLGLEHPGDLPSGSRARRTAGGLRSAQASWSHAPAGRALRPWPKLRSEARCLYLVMCPARAVWPRGKARMAAADRPARQVRALRQGALAASMPSGPCASRVTRGGDDGAR